MSHAITDGGSITILQNDLNKAYAGTLSTVGLLDISHDFALERKSISAADQMAFWKKKLEGVVSCHFPSLSDAPQSGRLVSKTSIRISENMFTNIHRFCEEHTITPASLFQSAWALTLAAYAGTDSVCFGYLASGRDLPVQGIADSIGAYANMLICRADISRNWTGQQFIRHIYDQVIEDLAFQHCPLADIQHELNVTPGQSLFNTIMSFRTQPDDKVDSAEEGSEGFVFISREAKNLTEVSALLHDTELCLY